MHSDEVIWHEKSGGTTWNTSYRCCILRKVVSKEVAIEGRFHFFWTRYFQRGGIELLLKSERGD